LRLERGVNIMDPQVHLYTWPETIPYEMAIHLDNKYEKTHPTTLTTKSLEI